MSAPRPAIVPPVRCGRDSLGDHRGGSHAVRSPWRRAGVPSGHRARCDRDPHSTRTRGARAGRGGVRDHGPGAPGRSRPGAGATGGSGGRDPEGSPVRHDQQGVRVVDPRDRDRRPHDSGRRARARRHRRHGVDVERAVPAAEGPLRISPRKRRGRRPRGLRRTDVVLRRAAHGGAGIGSSRASSGSRARSRTNGRTARTSVRPRRRTQAVSTTRSSPSATSSRTRASVATRRSRGSPRCSRSSTPTARQRQATHQA